MAWASKECEREGRAWVRRREREELGEEERKGVPNFIGRERGDERAPGASRRSSMAPTSMEGGNGEEKRKH
jgi:hypothetical protein